MAYKRITVSLPPRAVSFANQRAKELAKTRERTKPNLSEYVANLIRADEEAFNAQKPMKKAA